MKKTKRSLFTSLVTLLLCTAMFVGSTFAWFTDTVSNTGNRIQAGTLKVGLLMDKMQDGTEESYVSIANGTGDIFATDETKASEYKDSHLNGILWEPGKTEIAYLAVENKGNLALKYKLVLDVQDLGTHEGVANTGMAKAFDFVIVDGAHTPLDAITSWQDAVTKSGMTPMNLWDAIQVANPGQHSGRIDPAGQGVLDGINQEPKVENERDYFAIVVHMDENAGNDYQAGTILFDLNLVATQLNSEFDGFDNPNYDETATYPIVSAKDFPKFDPKNPGTDDLIIQKVGKIESANVPVAAASDVVSELISQLPNPPEETDNQKLTLTLNVTELGKKEVEEESKTTTTVNLDIDMSAILVITAQDGTVKGSKSETVKEMSGWTVIKYQLDPNLTNVKVTHSGNDMVESEDTGADLGQGIYKYNPTDGILTIKTKTFSPFDVTYDVLKVLTDDEIIAQGGFVRIVNNNTIYSVDEETPEKYRTKLQECIDDSVSGDKIRLLKDITIQDDSFGFEAKADDKFDFDLNNFTITYRSLNLHANANSFAFKIASGAEVSVKDGKIINLNGGSQGLGVSCVINNSGHITSLYNVELENPYVRDTFSATSPSFRSLNNNGSGVIDSIENCNIHASFNNSTEIGNSAILWNGGTINSIKNTNIHVESIIHNWGCIANSEALYNKGNIVLMDSCTFDMQMKYTIGSRHYYTATICNTQSGTFGEIKNCTVYGIHKPGVASGESTKWMQNDGVITTLTGGTYGGQLTGSGTIINDNR